MDPFPPEENLLGVTVKRFQGGKWQKFRTFGAYLGPYFSTKIYKHDEKAQLLIS